MIEPKILYEDQHIIVCVKPSGVLSQEDETKDPDMVNILKKYIKVRDNKPGNVFIGLVHRLDRMTSGIMVFAKRSKAAKYLFEDINNGNFHKSYIALIQGTLDNKNGTLKDKVLKNEKELKAYISSDGKDAILNYKVLKKVGSNSYVEVELVTGRYHQIRVQFGNIKHPLVGDSLYGSKSRCNYKLHAYKLEFLHPMTKEKLIFEQKPEWY